MLSHMVDWELHDGGFFLQGNIYTVYFMCIILCK